MASFLFVVPDGRSVGEHGWYRLVMWVGTQVFGLAGINANKGSGDRMFDWVQMAVFLVMASVVASVWMAIERRRLDEARLRAWWFTGLRCGLGGVLMFYGAIKVFPVQMVAPSLTRLFEPVGQLTPMDLLWTWVGASHPYERVIGGLEVGAALLLFIPRTASIGAIAALLETAYIFVLDLAYDVPVKLWIAHLTVMALILAWPDLPRIIAVLTHRRSVDPAPQTPLFRSPALARMAVWAQVAIGVYAGSVHLMFARAEWVERDVANVSMGAAYGAWAVADTSDVAGQLPWRRVIFEQGTAAFQRLDDSFVRYRARVDQAAGTMALAISEDAESFSTLNFSSPAHGQLVVRGRLDGRDVALTLRTIDTSTLPLVSHPYRLSQEAPSK